MSNNYRFETTNEPQKLRKVFSLAGTEWSGKLTPEEFGEIEAKNLVDFILKGNPGRAFYLESRTGDIHASCVVTQHKAVFKEAGITTIGTVPDPSLFGVNNGTAIRLSFVFVAKEARGNGLMGSLIRKAIEYTEAEILKKELAKSSDKQDSFKLMVLDGDKVDQTLVQHYLGKKYVWFLYSAIGKTYEKFGFKEYPLEGYKIDQNLSLGKTYLFVEKLLASEAPKEAGKKLRLLDGDRTQDRDLIDQILQGKQLEILTDLNKNVYHSELLGDLHSSLSLSNLSSTLSSSRPGSSKELSSITMKFKETFLGSSDKKALSPPAEDTTQQTQQRRKSSILLLGCPKFAILPDFNEINHKFVSTKAAVNKVGTDSNKKYANINGAVLTNELQRKSFYILWMMVKGTDFTIIAMGELRLDLFGVMADPLGFTNPIERRRSSSFTGINDMGGFNFQDLDLLVNTAVYVARQLSVDAQAASVFVNINDLPTTIPRPVLHDFFLNYLPKAYEVNEVDSSKKEKTATVTFLENLSDCQILPMLRKYGNNDGTFELDWVANSLSTWG